MTVTAVPTNTLVATEWLKTLTGYGIDPNLVGPSLPNDESVWDEGFFQVVTVGGSRNNSLGTDGPVVVVQCWAHSPNSSTAAPFNRVESMAQTVVRASQRQTGRFLTVAGFPVWLIGINVTDLPRRVPDERSNFARCDVTLQAWWGENS